MILTSTQIAGCCPDFKDPAALAAILNKILPQYEITSVRDVAEFLAQCGHESCDFTKLEENLNYSAAALRRQWPKRFPDDASAAAYARRPIDIANKVYSNRMGNGPESSGDGWKFRGCGAFQLTGRNNQTQFATYKNMPLESVHAYLTTTLGAVDSACWFWEEHALNQYHDDFDGLCDAINIGRKTEAEGDAIGFADRKLRLDRCLQHLDAPGSGG